MDLTGRQSEKTSHSTEPHKILQEWGHRLGRDKARSVLSLLVWLQLQALGPVSAKDLTMGQHFFYQDLSEAWVGHGREV